MYLGIDFLLLDIECNLWQLSCITRRSLKTVSCEIFFTVMLDKITDLNNFASERP